MYECFTAKCGLESGAGVFSGTYFSEVRKLQQSRAIAVKCLFIVRSDLTLASYEKKRILFYYANSQLKMTPFVTLKQHFEKAFLLGVCVKKLLG